MAEYSKIEWTHHTFNPWIGCSKVSAGCKNCYAEDLMAKRYKRVEWGDSGERVKTSVANWKKPLSWNLKARNAGERHRVFCASLADVFEDKEDQNDDMDNWRRELFDMIINTPHLEWLLLTKRPENVNSTIERVTGFSDSGMWFHAAQNVWLGTSVEDQGQADIRIPHLIQVPAKVRFLSCEPLLEAVDLFDYLPPFTMINGEIGKEFVHWVIVGGESGRNARPMHPDWVRSLRDQCQEASVAFHFKQWGEYIHDSLADEGHKKPDSLRNLMISGKLVFTEMDCSYWKVGKKAAGRTLDGRTWDEYPAS